jgi:hypothetical protein
LGVSKWRFLSMMRLRSLNGHLTDRAVSPNSSATTSADFPLLSQFWTASRLKVSSNFRRLLTDDVLMELIIYDFPQLSVRHFGATADVLELLFDDAAESEASFAEADRSIQCRPQKGKAVLAGIH